METNKLSCKDLMIGDSVLVKPSKMLINIVAIHHNKVAYHSYANRLIWVEEGLLEPIPLTPESLKKNESSHNIYWHNIFKDIDNYHINIQFGTSNKVEYIHIKEIGMDEFVPSKQTDLYLTHIQYVHELQRALKLCGITREIITKLLSLKTGSNPSKID